MFLIFIGIVMYGLWIVSSYLTGCDPFYYLKPRVYLLDSWGEIRPSRLYVGHGDKFSYAYPETQVGLLVLNSDGTTSGLSYIEKWSMTGNFT
jgi:hypothetical protein